ncbi:MAG: cupin [Sphingomonas sp. SCN 67-18]|uniref:cupin domain-containing protein n=1 Tax=uncultured Sphingomonas sp. TaxID=158754 RepID=UPI00086E9369|nr:cupin domain-containing protein [Sphingomonas sp. SCN 67-18]ODU20330.1 MAG: cupin [Sphingomonas sp. SCN 67-18]
MSFAGFDIDAFLAGHWQKKPLLIRNPWADWRNPIEPDDLAGLACEEDVESRLVIRTGADWSVEHGPLAEARFAALGGAPWTLLVQAVDSHAPEVAALIEPFRFIPNWRIDDVMVSYATDGGGVGPHFDQYDVFLIQGLGRRRWRLGGMCDAATPLRPHDELRLLADFDPVEEWVLEPGDILYVPPGIAHEGVAMGDDCMTYSVGFRAPARSELIAHWCDHLLAELDEDDRYADPALRAAANPGEIAADALARLQAMVVDIMADRQAFARWFGQYSSQPKYPEADWRPDRPVSDAAVRAAIAGGAALLRNAASRFSFIRQAAGLSLFVDGVCFDCEGETAALAESLCARTRIVVDAGLARSAPAVALVAALINQGSLEFADPQ